MKELNTVCSKSESFLINRKIDINSEGESTIAIYSSNKNYLSMLMNNVIEPNMNMLLREYFRLRDRLCKRNI